MSGPLRTYTVVADFTRHQGDLIAAGRFTRADGVSARQIAAWDGDGWRPLGDGLEGQAALGYAVTSFRGEPFAGGYFTTAGDNVSAYWARWSSHCRGDINRDGEVDLEDLSTLLAHFGEPDNSDFADGDLDGDSAVGLTDLVALLSSFGVGAP